MRTLINDIIDKIKAALGVSLLLGGSAFAQSHYFDADHPGHGVSVTQDSGQGSSFIWYTYNRSGEGRWLISTENCTDYPCQTTLAQAYGTWMGGEFELVEVGSVTVDFIDGQLFWEYDLSAWPDAGDCGRMVWLYQTKCIGQFKMQAID